MNLGKTIKRFNGMSLSYKRHFPDNWSDEKVEGCVLNIVTDPKIQWKRITGQEHGMCRPSKYIADGECEGKRIRIIVEPDNRWVLAAYLLDPGE